MPATNFPNGIRGPLLNASGAQPTTIADITDSTGGTADGTLADVGASFSQATLNNNFADLAAKVNAIIAALEAAQVTDS